MYGFHKNTRLYVDAIQRAGFVSFSAANEKLIDDMIRNLIFTGIWDRLGYLFIAANDGSGDVGKVNLKRPLMTPGTGSPSFVSKKGIAGNIVTGFAPITDTVEFTPASNDTSFWSYLVTGGAASVPIDGEGLIQWSGANTLNQQIRVRTTPRIDCLINLTVASPVQLVSGFPQNNTLYYCENSVVSAVITRYAYTNKTNRFTTASSGSLPSTGTVSYGNNIDSSRAIGGIGGGQGLVQPNLYANSGGLADILKTYFDAVQLL